MAVAATRHVKREKRNDPLPLLAILGGMILEGAFEHLVGTIVDSVMKPVDKGAELASSIATYKLYKGIAISNAIDAIKEAFFIEPRADDTGYNIDYQKFEEVMDKLMYATIVMSALISEDASEITMEMLQESLSNSLQYGLGGMWALMSAYASGFGIPQGLTFVGENDIHPYTLASLDAWTGQLKHFLIAQHYVRVKGDWEDAHRNEINRWIAKGHESLVMLKHYIVARVMARFGDAVERMVDSIVEMASVMLRRIHDLTYALMAAYNDYRAGILSDYEFQTIAVSISNALDAIDRELDNLAADALELGSDAQFIVTKEDGTTVDVINELETALTQEYYAIVDRMNATINSELKDNLARYISALNNIRVKSSADIEYTFSFDGVQHKCVGLAKQDCPTQ